MHVVPHYSINTQEQNNYLITKEPEGTPYRDATTYHERYVVFPRDRAHNSV